VAAESTTFEKTRFGFSVDPTDLRRGVEEHPSAAGQLTDC
jgi:hypothetical protein